MKYKNITKDFLEKNYIELRKSLETLGKELKCDKHVVGKALKFHNIKHRNKGRFNKKLIGLNSGYLTVVSREFSEHVKCLCNKCGRYSIVQKSSIINKNTKSCGCMKEKMRLEKIRKGNGLISGSYWYY